MAQSTMPWNPDANDDSYVGASDMLSTLAVYGQQVGIDSSLTCDYEGSSLEEWLGDLWSGIILLDSVFVQWHVEDSAVVYVPGCPDPMMDYVSFERAGMLTSVYEYTNYAIRFGGGIIGGSAEVAFFWDAVNGTYQTRVVSSEVNAGLSEVLGSAYCYTLEEALPISGEMSEEGIVFDLWGDGFLSSATYVNILPYWHYAE